MIEQSSVVTHIAPGQVRIKSRQNAGCCGCAQQDACTTATLAKLLPNREFSVESDLDLQVGDQVLVAINDSHLLTTSVLLYLAPLIVMLLATGAADVFLPASIADNWLPGIALFSLLATFWLINRFQSLLLLYFSFRPQIVRKL
ncbi:MAG: SoxR reducing system RseC family protein [Methylomonas sp.]|jgi:sigma-E factor negative regulatory protein RseC